MNKKIKPDEITQLLEQELTHFEQQIGLEEVGIVLEVNHGIVKIYGLEKVETGELISFENGLGALVLNLEENHVGAILLGDSAQIKEGDKVKRTNKRASLQVGEGMVGRIVDALGYPIDGKGKIKGALFEMPFEREAPGVIYREPVREPLQTGIKSIDTMIPIGRGQRELVVGDRQTGKTTLALDTIINQRQFFEAGNPVYCIYVAIGQKASSVAYAVEVLERYGAMAYTTIVTAPASAPASLQYLAPFAATALGEFFRDTGHAALIVYDDLSKQAIAYREISLLLRRPPGREAYPGDVFYLHARLLERAAKLTSNPAIVKHLNGLPSSLKRYVQPGGSLTALPIIETQAGDVAAYIPTNVISITDGQIFLDTKLFYADLRPAIDIGISVSRVGGAAQKAAMKKIAGRLKIEQAQFEELESFAKFGSNLDELTQKILKRGNINRKLFTQPPYNPVELGLQLCLVYIATEGCLDPLPLSMISSFEKKFSSILLNEEPKLVEKMNEGVFDEATQKIIKKIATNIIEDFT